MGIFSTIGEKVKTGLGDMQIGVTNIIKKPLRRAGMEFHFKKAGKRRLATYKKYEPMVKYLRGINNELVEIETNFDKTTEEIMPKVNEFYRFIGPYTDDKLIKFEQNYASKGTMLHVVNGKVDKSKQDFDNRDITINGKKFEFVMPPKKTILFEDDFFREGCEREEEVTYFGYEQTEFWKKKFNKLIDDTCEHTKAKIEQEVKTPEEKKAKIDYIEIVQATFKTKISHLFREKVYSGGTQTIGGYEKMFHSTYLRGIFNKIETDYSSLLADIKKIRPQKVKYKHTYKVAIPVWRSHDGTELARLNIAKPRDDSGMPWEVDDNNRIMVGPHAGIKIDPEMIRELPLYAINAYVANEFDSYRDELRDGRYHPESLTVTDYLMANHDALGKEWKTKNENTLTLADRKYKMKLQDGTQIEGVRKPSNINPAFDLNKFNPISNGTIGIPKKDWIHIGRKYYHDFPGKIKGDELDAKDKPAATTRGTAMFLIDKFLSEGMLLSEVHEDLKYIGEFAGFDYGPRSFGDAFCKDPFNMNLGPANASVQPKK